MEGYVDDRGGRVDAFLKFKDLPAIGDDKEGIKIYHTLKEDYKHLEKGNKLLVVESKRFDKNNLTNMFVKYGLKPVKNQLYETKGTLVGAFSKK